MTLPRKLKRYNCFDDGKITPSRQYKVLVTDIYTWSDAPDGLKELCTKAIEYWKDHYKQDQTHIVIGVSYEQNVPTIEIFLETTYNAWFGIGDYNNQEKSFDCYWNSGILDVDNSLTENLKEKL